MPPPRVSFYLWILQYLLLTSTNMSTATESYESAKSRFTNTLLKLEQDVNIVESYGLLMKLKTEGYLKAIQDLRHPYDNCSFYIIRWFRTFVGIKDEAMLSLNGVLMRKYHRKQHEDYLHTRGNETIYYKTGVLGLSSCSVDGLNYERRAMTKKLPKKNSREEERLDALADRVIVQEERLDELCKNVNNRVNIMKAELKKKCPYIVSVIIDIGHKAEQLVVKYDPKLTHLKDFTYTCHEARTGSRKLALHSGIEDPTSEVVVQAAPVSHHRAAVADDEDREYANQVAVQKAATALAEQRAKEEQARQAPDFGFDYSIDKEKREFGAFELLAIPEDRNANDDDDMMMVEDVGSVHAMDVVDGGFEEDGDEEPAQWQFKPEVLNPDLSALRNTRLLKIKLHPHGVPAAASTTPLTRTDVAGTRITVFRQRDSQVVSHFHLTIEVNVSKNFAEQKLPPGSGALLRVQEVLEEVQRQLWLSSADLLGDLLHLPRALRINNVDYCADALVTLPEENDLAKKRYLVKVDNHPLCTELTARVAAWIRSKTEVEARVHAQELLWSQRSLVRQVVVCGAAAEAAAVSGAPSQNTHVLSLCGGMLCPPLEEQEGDFHDLLNALFSTAAPPFSTLGIAISGSTAFSGCLAELMYHAMDLQAKSSGISFLDLLQCAVQLVQSKEAAGALLRSLDLSHNHFLSYCDAAPWERLLHSSAAVLELGNSGATTTQPDSEPMDLDTAFFPQETSSHNSDPGLDPFEQFATALFCELSLLDSINLSHCATSETQARCLCDGVLQAVKCRAHKGFPPVRSIVLNGLEERCPHVADNLKKSLDVYGLEHTVDCGGYSLCI